MKYIEQNILENNTFSTLFNLLFDNELNNSQIETTIECRNTTYRQNNFYFLND